MRKSVFSLSAAAIAMTLAACEADHPQDNLAAEDGNAVINLREQPPLEPAENEVETVVEQPEPSASAPKPAAPTMPAPVPAKPKPPAPEPAPDPHAGHDMNNLY